MHIMWTINKCIVQVYNNGNLLFTPGVINLYSDHCPFLTILCTSPISRHLTPLCINFAIQNRHQR